MTQPPSGPSAPPPQWYAAGPAAPARLPRAPISLPRPLVWTAFFTGVGIALLAAAVAVLLLAVALLIWMLGSALGGDMSGFWSGVGDQLGPMALDLLPLFALVSLAALTISSGVLLAYRLADGFRRWPAVLQGLSAASTTYVATVVLGELARVVT
jgi:Flp pilus assembly pilin Flp